MKKICLFFVILLASVFIGLQIEKDPGYVLIAIQNWTIETPLWLAVVLILLTYFVIQALVKMLTGAGKLRYYWHRWQRRAGGG